MLFAPEMHACQSGCILGAHLVRDVNEILLPWMFLSQEMLTAVLNALSKLWHLLKVSGLTLYDD